MDGDENETKRKMKKLNQFDCGRPQPEESTYLYFFGTSFTTLASAAGLVNETTFDAFL